MLTINITLYLPPWLQLIIVARQAMALSGLTFPGIGRMMLAEKDSDSIVFIAMTTLLY
jgi:hypothetical protein